MLPLCGGCVLDEVMIMFVSNCAKAMIAFQGLPWED